MKTEEQIFEINGIKYKRSQKPLNDNDEVYCISKEGKISAADIIVPYGTKGKISSVWYDRVEYNGVEFVIWPHQTAKLEPIISSQD